MRSWLAVSWHHPSSSSPFPLPLLCLTSSSMSAGLLGPVLCLLADAFLDLLFKLFCRDEDDCCCLFFFLGLTVNRRS